MALLAGTCGSTLLLAQSLDAGAVSGTVKDRTGRGLPEATITLTEHVTGVTRMKQTPRSGSYGFTLLPPSEYDLLVERFGYRPHFVRALPVRAGSSIRFDIVLDEGGGIDTTSYPGAPPGGAHLSLDGGAADDELAAISDPAALMTGAASLLPGVGIDLTTEGLPGRMGATALDGLTRWSARQPRVSNGVLSGVPFPLAAVHGVEMLPGGMDAEWPGSGGGLLSGFTVPGARRLSTRITVAAGPDGQTGSLAVLGPAVRDTAHFAFGISATHLTPKMPAPWGSDSLTTAVVATAKDSLWADLSPYQQSYKPTTTIFSGFGAFDWRVTADHRLTLRVDGAGGTIDDPQLDDQPVTLGSSLKIKDLSAAALLTSTIGSRAGSEFKLGVDGGSQDYTGSPLPSTTFTDGGFTAGTSSLLPGNFSRTSIRVSETLHYRFTGVALKVGIQFGFNSFDQTFADGRAGSFAFGDSLSFAGRRGSFYQAVGPLADASFKTSTIAGFLQGLFRPTSTLDLTVGLRYEQEHIPVDQIRPNGELLRLTGIDNRNVPPRRIHASPRVSFIWTPDASRRLQVSGEVGQFVEPSDPGVLAEALTRDAGVTVRRGFGSLRAWATNGALTAPDTTAAPLKSQSLALLTSGYAPPQTARARLGITGNMHGTVLRLQTAYRHTDFLPLRRDLNLPASANAHDQNGRVLYGTLTKAGSLVGPVPGSNRRFSEFDDISALDPSAASDYYGVSAGIERPVARGISLMFSYTYSHTTDNWYGARSGTRDGQLVPFADSSGTSSWAKGRSDFDIPNRATVGADIHFRGGRGAHLVALLRYRSGYPFTPGFHQGVDMNGDGSGSNDPAFVIDTLPGASAVVGSNSCLRGQIGRFAQRNSCRDPAALRLDLRFGIGLSGVGRPGTELMVDALGVVSSGNDVIDHALYLVDSSAPLTTSPSGATVVPLTANPNFGHTLVKRNPGVALRVGIRMEL